MKQVNPKKQKKKPDKMTVSEISSQIKVYKKASNIIELMTECLTAKPKKKRNK